MFTPPERFTDPFAYRLIHGPFSLCFCILPAGIAIIRSHDKKSVFTVCTETLEEKEHPATGFFDVVILFPTLADEMSIQGDQKRANEIIGKQLRAEEHCGFFRPQ